MRNCKSLRIVAACGQLRMRECSGTTLMVLVPKGAAR
eukprot:gene5545-15740_t